MFTKGEWKARKPKLSTGWWNIGLEGEAADITTVWSAFKNTKDNAHLIAAAPDMYKALKEISEGKGAYSFDPLEHASNTINNMKELAEQALTKAEGE